MVVDKQERIRSFLESISGKVNIEDGVNALFNEAYKYFAKLNIYGNAKTINSKRAIDYYIKRALNSLASYSSSSSLCDIKIIAFKEALDLIKEPNFQYNKGIPERVQIGIRKLAVILDHIHNTNEFSQYAKVLRKSGTEVAFKELIEIESSSVEINKWIELSTEFINQLQTKNTKSARAATARFLKYLTQKYKTIPHPFTYLSKPRHKNFVREYKEIHKTYSSDLIQLLRFSEYIIDNYMSDEYEAKVKNEHTVLGYPIVTERQVYSGNHTQDKPKRTHTDKLLIPTNILFLMRDVISEDDFAFPKSLSSHYFYYINESGHARKMFNPVPSYLYLTMLEVPIRKIQAQMLDSGEGDVIEFCNGEWMPSTSVHARFWERQGASLINRGVLTQLEGVDGAGFYINTNKTQDIKVGHGEHSGYTIPWYNQELVSHLQALRDFQAKYNPVKKPKAYRDIDKSFLLNDGRPSEAVLNKIPDRFYLFRNPSSPDPESPVSSNVLHRYFLEIMQEVEKRLHAQGEDIKIITKVNDKTGQPERSIYTPHGLRVAGLTAMAENGVPIEVLSKIVAGHASILMTLHYIVHSDRKVSEVLSSARKEIESQAKLGLKEWLKDAAFEDAKRYLHANNDQALVQLLDNVDAAFTSSNSYGVCPYAGTRCHDGGDEIKKATKTTQAKYGPVRGGKSNCVMCRHFVTGKEWAIELWLHTNKLFELIHHLSVEVDEYREQKKTLTKKRYEFTKQKQQHLIPITLLDDIKSLDFVIEEKSEALNDAIYSAHASYNIYQGIKNLDEGQHLARLNDNRNPSSAALIDKNESEGVCVETSRFAAQHLLVSASRLYPQFKDSRVELERNQFIDQVYANASVVPIGLSPMSNQEKRNALDAASDYLLNKLSDVELQNLHSGAVGIENLDINREKLISPLGESRNRIGQKDES